MCTAATKIRRDRKGHTPQRNGKREHDEMEIERVGEEMEREGGEALRWVVAEQISKLVKVRHNFKGFICLPSTIIYFRRVAIKETLPAVPDIFITKMRNKGVHTKRGQERQWLHYFTYYTILIVGFQRQ